MIKLIISADDFGMTDCYNKGILDLLSNEQITSISVMVNRNIDKIEFEKLKKLKKIKRCSVGLHLEFTNNSYEVSIKQQLNKFTDIFNFKPSHFDIHKGIKFI